MTDLTPEESYCEIINDTCPYEYFCSSCRLCRDYEKAKEDAAKLKSSGKDPE